MAAKALDGPDELAFVAVNALDGADEPALTAANAFDGPDELAFMAANALDLLQLALDSNLRNLGDEHPNVARDRSNLGVVLKDQGQFEAARDHFGLALATMASRYGVGHPHVPITHGHLDTLRRLMADDSTE